jgi:uncharacterized membrane protein
MTGRGWTRPLRALLIAASLLALTLFAAANFVLVDIRLPGGAVRVRVAWVAVAPSLCAFAVGLLYARLRQREQRDREATTTASADPLTGA